MEQGRDEDLPTARGKWSRGQVQRREDVRDAVLAVRGVRRVLGSPGDRSLSYTHV